MRHDALKYKLGSRRGGESEGVVGKKVIRFSERVFRDGTRMMMIMMVRSSEGFRDF